jgi:hypothetical protein
MALSNLEVTADGPGNQWHLRDLACTMLSAMALTAHANGLCCYEMQRWLSGNELSRADLPRCTRLL